MTAFETVVDKLVATGKKVRTVGEGRASAQCPAHDDKTPSLSVTRIEGSVLLHCHGGCDTDNVLAALGLAKRDLFDDTRGARYDYADRSGTIIRTVSRTPDKKFHQSGITGSPTLYRLPQVVQAVTDDQVVYLVEGEKDVHALEAIGLTATTAPMGADSFGKVDATPLHGGKVVAVVDKDSAGQKWAALVHNKLDGMCQSLTFVQAADGKDAADHIAAGHGVDDFVPLDLDQEATDRAKRLFPRLDWHDLWADEEEEEWIHYPLLPARRLVALFSAAKVGKSLLLLEFAVAISRGEMFLGSPCVQKRVLYVDFENDPRGDVRSRLQAMGYGPDDLDGLDYLSFPTMAALDSARGSLELMEIITAYGSQVAIIDTVSRAVDGEENSNDTWLNFYRHTGLKLKQAGVSLYRLDHTGKDETKGQRGGSAKSGDVDVIWQMTRVTESRFRLDCKDTRLPIGTKTITLDRLLLPKLHHALVAAGGVSDFDAKVNALVALCDANDLDPAANREAVRAFAITRGIKASGKVIQEVVKVRKNTELVESSSELLPEFTPSEKSPDLLNSPREFTPSTDPPKVPDLSTKHLNSGARVQQSSPTHGTTELLGSSIHTAQESSPVQTDKILCQVCHTPLNRSVYADDHIPTHPGCEVAS